MVTRATQSFCFCCTDIPVNYT